VRPIVRAVNAGAVPPRLLETAELLSLRGDERVLEVGCGPGVAADLLLGRHAALRYVAVDRSATAIERTRRRNADALASERLATYRLDLGELTAAAVGGEPFDVAFAVNVNVFWTMMAGDELRRLAECLRPGGVLWLVFDTPGDATRHAEILERVRTSVAASDGALVAPTVVAGDTVVGLRAVRAG
jgi:SAM-dependent methyltransferase